MSPAPFPHHWLPCGMPSFACVILIFNFIALLHCEKVENSQFMQCCCRGLRKYSFEVIENEKIERSKNVLYAFIEDNRHKQICVYKGRRVLLESVCDCEISRLLGHGVPCEAHISPAELCLSFTERINRYFSSSCWFFCLCFIQVSVVKTKVNYKQMLIRHPLMIWQATTWVTWASPGKE